MRILEYTGLDTRGVKAAYDKVVKALERDDFRAAQVKKLHNLQQGKFYRARLDDSNRLLFSLVRHGDEVCALMLEVILQHDYDKSRFMRGAAIDETRIEDADLSSAKAEAQALRYLHPQRAAMHLLDKPISLDDAQQAVLLQAPPLIVVGSAGSGKTALTLEKLKNTEGEVLYVTLSAYLAQNARDLYFANGFEHSAQDATFLSYREFLESIRVPIGREAQWRDFAGWFARQQAAFRGVDGHQAFEEIRGVLTAQPDGLLTRQSYAELGLRQSIFAPEQRARMYDLFERYREWLTSAALFDLNLLAHERLALAAPRYDFVVIDEVQDITPVQLSLVLKTLKKPGQFLLCGDSNQIVHPNFFSWSQVKTLFWRDPKLAEHQQLSVLTANFRNGSEATRLANTLLKIKHARFGSIDRESNFLVQAQAAEAGSVSLLADRDAVKKELDSKIRQSTRFAVLVMRDEDKAQARQFFATPLLFSIHEAKGLEYDNIVLFRFVSDHRAEFAEIADGVDQASLQTDTLDYRRARDKTDKSLEIYKFYVNALYVALTRAIRNLYLVESDQTHPLFALLDLRPAEALKVQAEVASREDWQKEARKLELQGKQEQAEAIRNTILRQAAPPWLVQDPVRLNETLVKVFQEQVPGSKTRQQLFDYAAFHDEPVLAQYLVTVGQYEPGKHFDKLRDGVVARLLAPYANRQIRDVLSACDRYGVDHRTAMNQTPLMAAARAGNLSLVEALLERGADPKACDHYGQQALHWALREAFASQRFAKGPFAALYERIAPSSVDVQSAARLVRIDRHQSEYLLFQTFWALFKSRFNRPERGMICAFDTATILTAWQNLPSNVLPEKRKKRAYLSGVLARNEVERDYAYNRALFKRQRQGWYQFSPALLVRQPAPNAEAWMPACQALNLALIKQSAPAYNWSLIDLLLQQAGLPKAAASVAGEREQAFLRASRTRLLQPQPPASRPAAGSRAEQLAHFARALREDKEPRR